MLDSISNHQALAYCLVVFTHRLHRFLRKHGTAWIRALRNTNLYEAGDQAKPGRFKLCAARLLHFRHGEEFFFIILLLLFVASTWGFLGILQDVLAKDPLVLADQALYHFLQNLRNVWADHFFVAVTELGDSFVNICFASAVCILLLLKRCYRTAGFWLLAALGGIIKCASHQVANDTPWETLSNQHKAAGTHGSHTFNRQRNNARDHRPYHFEYIHRP